MNNRQKNPKQQAKVVVSEEQTDNVGKAKTANIRNEKKINN